MSKTSEPFRPSSDEFLDNLLKPDDSNFEELLKAENSEIHDPANGASHTISAEQILKVVEEIRANLRSLKSMAQDPTITSEDLKALKIAASIPRDTLRMFGKLGLLPRT